MLLFKNSHQRKHSYLKSCQQAGEIPLFGTIVNKDSVEKLNGSRSIMLCQTTLVGHLLTSGAEQSAFSILNVIETLKNYRKQLRFDVPKSVVRSALKLGVLSDLRRG